MAQYFHVLSQGDKTAPDGMRKLYHSNVENQNARYVSTPENQQQQQLQGQPQKMIVHRSSTHNSSGITISSPSSTVTQRNTDIPPLLHHQAQQKTTPDLKCVDGEEGVCLSDGIVAPVLDYKEVVAIRKQSANSNPVSSACVTDEMDTQEHLESKGNHFPRICGRPKNARPRRKNNTELKAKSNNVQLLQSQKNAELKSQAHQKFIQQQQLKMLRLQQRNTLPRTAVSSHRQQLIQQHQQQQARIRQQHQQLQQQLQQSFETQQQQQSPATQLQFQQQLLAAPQQQKQLQQQSHAPEQSPRQLSPNLPQVLPPRNVSPKPYVQPRYIIQHPSLHRSPRLDLPPCIFSGPLKEIAESSVQETDFPDSIRMLVLMETGEQRLITFTLPVEVCTIQEILLQVGVPFEPDTRIDCHETAYHGIHYLVTVGFHAKDFILQDESVNTSPNTVENIAGNVIPSSDSPNQGETSNYMSGLVAICNHCGYSSENLNQCVRCKHILKNEVKTTPVLTNDLDALDTSKDKKIIMNLKNPDFNNKKKAKTKMDSEPDVLTLSSDEENDPGTSNLSETDQLYNRCNNSSVTLSAIRKEPTITELKRCPVSEKTGDGSANNAVEEVDSDHDDVDTTIRCRTVRIGSYKCTPKSDLVLKNTRLIMNVPAIEDANVTRTVTLERKYIAKVLVSFQKALPVIFIYLSSIYGDIVRDALSMKKGEDDYFDPLSENESIRRITILPTIINTDARHAMKEVYKKLSRIEELNASEANDILIKTCPTDISKLVEATVTTSYAPGVRQLLIYPPGKGGLPINTEDYMCLAQDQFLNDVIIDFYLKYLVLQLPLERQEKIHVFSTFFYKRLTTKPAKASKKTNPAELDPTLTAAQRRHARVMKWTKNVNLFDKDFIIVPINENCHWYLAIICFPSLDGAYTMDGKRVVIEEKKEGKHSKGVCRTITFGNVTITNIRKEKERPISCDDGESDRDEAEGDESELETDSANESDSTDAAQKDANTAGVPIKQPCILIFDSLPGASRARVVATLRDYLTCEHKAKLDVERVFDKESIKGNCPKVPHQTNFTDCGLYLLQYVEYFLNHPIQSYEFPIKEIRCWFAEHTVTKKREDISLLIKKLMVKYNIDTSGMPVLALPTLNGKSVNNFEDDEEEPRMNDFDDEEDDGTHDDDDSSSFLNNSLETHPDLDGPSDLSDHSDLENSEPSSSQVNLPEELLPEITLIPKPSGSKKPDDAILETESNKQETKPEISEYEQLRRDTLTYLKSKRINRHKHSEPIDIKKLKTSYD